MNSSIEQILRSHYVDGVYHTHISMIQPKGKFQFNRTDIETFWELYCDTIKKEDDTIVGVGEKSQQYMPVLVDIDIKLPFDEEKLYLPKQHLYSNDQLKTVIQTYQQVLREIVDECSDEYLTCVVLEKDIYHIEQGGKQYTKNGFHLHFPWIILNKDDQANHLIPRVKKIIKELNLFSNLGFEDSSLLIDGAVLTAPWLLYRSRKAENMQPYKVTRIYDCNIQPIKKIEEAFKHYKIYDNNENRINIRGKVWYYMPRILSILPYGRDNMELKSNLPLPVDEKRPKACNQSERKSFERKEYTKNMEKDLELSAKLIHILSIRRADDFMDWFKVGCALFNISEGTEDGFDLFKEFSQRCSEKYDEDSCYEYWSTKFELREQGLNIGSLRKWAEEDDPEGYRNACFDGNKIDRLIDECLHGSHGNMAKLFRFLYGDNIKVIAQIPHIMFGHWNEDSALWTVENKTVMVNLISEVVTPYFREKLTKNISRLVQLENEKDKNDEEASLKAQIKGIQKMIGNLSSTPFLSNVCIYYSGFELDKEFETKLNSKPNELPIKNKRIINLKTKAIRERTKDDFFSFELDCDYIQNCNYDKVIDFFSGICCQNEDLIDYMKRLFGYCLTGEISDRSLHIFWGVGRNGKSTVIDIIRKILGKKLFVTCSENVLLKSNSSSSTSPELVRIQGARLIVLSETDKQEKLNSKRIKGLTGGDEIVARQLFREQIEFNPQATPIMITNHKPEFDINDQAMIDRLKMVPFLARFDNLPKNRGYIEDLLKNNLNDFFSWFVDGAYEWYNGKELIACEIMKKEMNAYINELDIQKQFIDERIEIINKEEYNKLSNENKAKYRMKKDSLYGMFLGYTLELGIRSTLTKSDFYKALDERFNIELLTVKGIRFFICKEKPITLIDE